jgi:hypothetical protein
MRIMLKSKATYFDKSLGGSKYKIDAATKYWLLIMKLSESFVNSVL